MAEAPKDPSNGQDKQKATEVGVTSDVLSDLLVPENKNGSNDLIPETDIQKANNAELISTFASSGSLQDKFKDFKKQRQEKYKNKQYLKNKKSNDRSTKEFQDLLRSKFVETAKKYLGVPYAKRYKNLY